MKKKLTEEHKRKIGDANRDTQVKYKDKYGEDIDKLLYQKYEIEKLDISRVSKSLDLTWGIVRHGLILFNIKIRKRRDYPISEETKNKLRGRTSSMKGKKHSLATKEKIREARRENPPDLLKKRKEKIRILKQEYSMEFKDLIWYLYFDQKKSFVEISKFIGYSPTHIKRLFKELGFKPRNSKDSHLGKKQSKWTILKRIKALRGKKRSKQAIRNVMKRRIPTELERKFQNIVDNYNLPYKYVGDGSFILENCNPDFININGKKIAVEVFARYYKNRDGRDVDKWKEKRSKIFSKYGWRIAYFNESQIEDKVVLKVLKRMEAT